jgi:hypothetical protein
MFNMCVVENESKTDNSTEARRRGLYHVRLAAPQRLPRQRGRDILEDTRMISKTRDCQSIAGFSFLTRPLMMNEKEKGKEDEHEP